MIAAFNATEFLQLVVVGVSTGAVYALVGIGFVFIYRTTGIINFAQGIFPVLAGMTTAALVDRDWPTWLAALAAIAITCVTGAVIGLVAQGQRGRTTHLASLIITLGLALIAVSVLLLIFGDIPKTYPAVSDRAWALGGVLVQPQYALIAAVTLLLAAGLTLLLRFTTIGNALVACSDSPRAAELVGLNVRALGVLAFTISAALCALGGVLLIPVLPFSYDSDVAIAVNGFAAAAFGGLVSIRAALVGGLILGIAANLVRGYIDPQYELAIALVIMLILIGWRSRHEVLTA